MQSAGDGDQRPSDTPWKTHLVEEVETAERVVEVGGAMGKRDVRGGGGDAGGSTGGGRDVHAGERRDPACHL